MSTITNEVPEAIVGAVARGWCAPENAHKVMDSDLAYAIAREVAALVPAKVEASELPSPFGSIADSDDFREDLIRLSDVGLSRKQAAVIRRDIYKTIDARVRNAAALASQVPGEAVAWEGETRPGVVAETSVRSLSPAELQTAVNHCAAKQVNVVRTPRGLFSYGQISDEAQRRRTLLSDRPTAAPTAPVLAAEAASVESVRSDEFDVLLDTYVNSEIDHRQETGTWDDAHVAHNAVIAHINAQVAKARQECEELRRQDHEQARTITHALMAERDALKASQSAAAPATPSGMKIDFDTWFENPYTKVLLKSIDEDYEPRGSGGKHADDIAIDRFATAMKSKMAKKRKEGRHGWQSCHIERLQSMLAGHLHKGDPVDVANFCMMLHHLGAPTMDTVHCKPWVDAAIAAINTAPQAAQPAAVPSDLTPLMKFYAVDSLEALAQAQEKHIAKLQAKLPKLVDEFTRTPREG